MYKPEFINHVKQAINTNSYVGTGNPNSRILFVGKEAKITEDRKEDLMLYTKNASHWQHHIENKTIETLNYNIGSDHIFKKEKSWGKNTWSKYQKLHDLIFNREPKKNEINFLENIFTTEINDAPNKNTASANKSNLNERKLFFKNSEFIQHFPIVVLACSNYIKNVAEKLEINEVFGVTYDETNPFNKKFNSSNWCYIHYNKDRTKLVIHTRQLSADVKNELLFNMSQIIKNHLNNINQL